MENNYLRGSEETRIGEEDGEEWEEEPLLQLMFVH